MAEPSAAPVVIVERATKQYQLGKTTVHALRGVDLTVARGEFLALAGPSGSGKTTMLNLIGGLERPTSGSVQINGVETASRSPDALAELRASSIGFVFQQFNLLPVFTALENVEYPLLFKKLSGRERRARATKALENVGLGSHLRHKPLELSGGQQQRVAIARAIVAEPLIVLADEPTANLDHATGIEILQLMRTLNRERQTTFIFSTHDSKVMELASRIVRLWDGALATGEHA